MKESLQHLSSSDDRAYLWKLENVLFAVNKPQSSILQYKMKKIFSYNKIQINQQYCNLYKYRLRTLMKYYTKSAILFVKCVLQL